MTGERIRVVLKPGAAKELEFEPEMVRMLVQKAGDVVNHAQQIAPRGDSSEDESYRGMIEAEVGPDGDRMVGRVNANKFTSHWIEWGTIHTKAHAVLRRATNAAGLRITGGRR